MADNVSLPAASGKAATREVTYSGETAHAQAVGLVTFSGSDDAKTATDVTASNALPVTAAATTGTVTSVNDAATSAQLLASSASRRGFRIFNDSTQILYVKYGTTASTTDYTVKLQPEAYLEEDGYSGRVDGIWAADGSGAARITELT